MFLIVVDAYFKWIDVHIMKFIMSTSTIEKLKIVFANLSLPCEVVTDNSSSFRSEEFQSFMSQYGSDHVTIAPYHPSSN